ncbi:hypothetical protein ABZP36_004222 [Zizania latifolia]
MSNSYTVPSGIPRAAQIDVLLRSKTERARGKRGSNARVTFAHVRLCCCPAPPRHRPTWPNEAPCHDPTRPAIVTRLCAPATCAASELPSNNKALLSKSSLEEDDIDRVDEQWHCVLTAGTSLGDDWSVKGLWRVASKITTLRMKLEEDDHDGTGDDEFICKAGLTRSASLWFRWFCAILTRKPKRMLASCGRCREPLF